MRGFWGLGVLVGCSGGSPDTDPTSDTDASDTAPELPEVTGELVFTEVMPASLAAGGTWLELRNPGTEPADLMGVELQTLAGVHALPALAVEPGGHVVLAASDDAGVNGGITAVDVVLPGLVLGGSSDTLALVREGETLDALAYDAAWSTGTAMPVGASISLDPSVAGDRDRPNDWCDGIEPYGDGGFGTPGRANPSCRLELEVAFEFVLTDGGTVDGEVGFTLRGRRFSTSDGGGGAFVRGTTSAGQSLRMEIDGTGVVYQGMRGFDTLCFAGGTMEGLPASAVSGTWTVAGCP
ncbi:MAG: lamin tail domain-containing protein [Myxococcota bacterium]